MIKEAITKIVTREDLTYDEAYTVMNEIMSGESTPTQNAAFLAALSTKSAKEIVRKQRKNGVENTARVLSTTDKPAATAIICLFGL